MEKLIEKAQTEYEGYDSEQSTPKPKKEAPSPVPDGGFQTSLPLRSTDLGRKDDIMRQKMEMFKEIQ